NGVVDTVRDLVNPTPSGDWSSVCVCSNGEYDTEPGLITGFPVRSDGTGWEVVPGLPIDDFSRGKIEATINELREEKSLVADLL
ncbi:MAG: malate dehydrogenase, partial [Planctomycetota bacterium]|nr:malate dehydrogenase [Planctomycetota bacterium]